MSSLQIAVLSQLIDCSCTGPTLQALSQHSPHWWQLPQPSCCFMGHSPQVAAPDQDCSSGGTHSHTSSCPLDSFQLSSSELSTEEMNVTFRSHHKRSKARPINFFLFHFINLEFTGNLSSETWNDTSTTNFFWNVFMKYWKTRWQISASTLGLMKLKPVHLWQLKANPVCVFMFHLNSRSSVIS